MYIPTYRKRYQIYGTLNKTFYVFEGLFSIFLTKSTGVQAI